MVKASYSIRLSLLIVALPFLFGAEIYKWVDEEGVVHFSERPERNTAPERINVSSGAGSRSVAPQPTALADPSTDSGARPLNPQQQAMQDQLNQDEATRMQDIAKARNENCQAAQERFDNLTQYARIRMRGDDGEYRVLTEDERHSEINQVKADVVEFCSG